MQCIFNFMCTFLIYYLYNDEINLFAYLFKFIYLFIYLHYVVSPIINTEHYRVILN